MRLDPVMLQRREVLRAAVRDWVGRDPTPAETAIVSRDIWRTRGVAVGTRGPRVIRTDTWSHVFGYLVPNPRDGGQSKQVVEVRAAWDSAGAGRWRPLRFGTRPEAWLGAGGNAQAEPRMLVLAGRMTTLLWDHDDTGESAEPGGLRWIELPAWAPPGFVVGEGVPPDVLVDLDAYFPVARGRGGAQTPDDDGPGDGD